MAFTLDSDEETTALLQPEVRVIPSPVSSTSPYVHSRGPVVLSVTVDHLVSQDEYDTSGRPLWNHVQSVLTTETYAGCSIQENDDDSNGGLRSGDNGLTQSQSSPTHCHVTPLESGVDKKARLRLILASLLCLLFMIGEIVGGLLAHSLAVVSDAAHLLTDFASFMISLVALYLAARPATKRLSFGWHRAEILGALVSILMLWVITGILVYSGVLRIQSGDYEIDATIMLITSGAGVGVNIVLGVTLHQHGHAHGGHSHDSDLGHAHTPRTPLIGASETDSEGGGQYGSIGGKSGGKQTSHGNSATEKAGKHKSSNLNVKAAFIHVIGDFCQSVGVLIAAIIIYFKPEWKIADPICTFLFSIFVLITTVGIMRDILVVLMEGAPKNINFEEVRDTILKLEGVKDLHDLRLWSLTLNKTALSVHLAVEKGVDPMKVVQSASYLIQQKYNISQTTMQVEEYTDEMDNCSQCQGLKD